MSVFLPQTNSSDGSAPNADLSLSLSQSIGYFIPSILYGKNKESIAGQGNFTPDCCAFFWIHLFCSCAASCLSYNSRTEVRKAYNLKEQPCGDCCVHFWCVKCALCQEARELKLRGATPTNPLLRPVQVVPPPVVVPPAQQQMPGPAVGVPASQQTVYQATTNPLKS